MLHETRPPVAASCHDARSVATPFLPVRTGPHAVPPPRLRSLQQPQHDHGRLGAADRSRGPEGAVGIPSVRPPSAASRTCASAHGPARSGRTPPAGPPRTRRRGRPGVFLRPQPRGRSLGSRPAVERACRPPFRGCGDAGGSGRCRPGPPPGCSRPGPASWRPAAGSGRRGNPGGARPPRRRRRRRQARPAPQAAGTARPSPPRETARKPHERWTTAFRRSPGAGWRGRR